MARLAVADGIRTVIVTPHQLGSFGHNSADQIRSQTHLLQQRLAQDQVPLELLSGADVRIEPDLPERIRDGHVLTLADRGRHVLLELPHELYVPLDGLLRRLQAINCVGILSHPERNLGILADPPTHTPLGGSRVSDPNHGEQSAGGVRRSEPALGRIAAPPRLRPFRRQ